MMEQIDKNTVKAENQLKENDYISYINPLGKDSRVMFVGNSITRHGKKPEIGWDHDWGMAASTKEKDYVHLLVKKVTEKEPDAVFCICQASQWETHCYDPEKVLSSFEKARDFQADLIIFRISENFSRNVYEPERLKKNYQDFIDYLNPEGSGKVILTTGFWKRKEDQIIRKMAIENSYPLVELNDLGEDDLMKAIGLFKHSGVANHPGDLGMEKIAERIFSVMKEMERD